MVFAQFMITSLGDQGRPTPFVNKNLTCPTSDTLTTAWSTRKDKRREDISGGNRATAASRVLTL
eukprot:12640194-Heterocapsa_arctica.AAC.1